MKKRLICLSLALLMCLSLASCFRSNTKFDYDMSKFITIPDYENYEIKLELDQLQAAIDSYLVKYASQYTVTKGDDIYLEVTANEVIYIGEGVDQKGNDIPAITNSNLLLEKIGDGAFSKYIESEIIGKKIGDVLSNKYTLKDDFFLEEWRGKEIYLDIKIKNRAVKLGEIANVAYTGYYLDENGNIAKDDKGNDKTFDSSESASFYLGSKLAIDDFEENIVGMLIGKDHTREFNATFPEDYGQDDLNGKTVRFKVELKSIYIPPVYNNTFIKDNFPDYSTTYDFEESLKDEFILDSVFNYIVENCEIISYPKSEYRTAEKELKDVESDFYEANGVTLDSYINSLYGMTREEYIKSNMKAEMVYYALRQIGEIEPTNEQLTVEKLHLIDYYTSYYMSNHGLEKEEAEIEAERFVENLGDTYIFENVFFEIVDDMLVKKAKVTVIDKTYTSITESIAKDDIGITE